MARRDGECEHGQQCVRRGTVLLPAEVRTESDRLIPQAPAPHLANDMRLETSTLD